MKIKELLKDNKPVVLKKWFESIIATYPAETGRYFKNTNNAFANPVGSTVAEAIEVVYDSLAGLAEPKKLRDALDRIVRIRAIQDFPPSGAVGFVYLLKTALKETLGDKADNEQYLVLSDALDAMALICFDIYMECTKDLYRIRVEEARNSMHMLLRRAGELVEQTPGGIE